MSPFTTSRHPALLSMVCLGSIIPANARADGLLPPDRPISEVIDHYIDAKLAKVKVKPDAPLKSPCSHALRGNTRQDALRRV